MLRVLLVIVPYFAGACATSPASWPTPVESRNSAQPVQEVSETYGPDSNDFLISGAMSFARAEYQYDTAAQDTKTYTFSTSVSYFIDRTNEIGLSGAYQEINVDEGSAGDGDTAFLYAFYNFNYDTSPRTTLYAGPQAGWARFDNGNDSSSDLTYGVHIGLRHWLHPHVSIVIEPQYFYTNFADEVGGETDFYQVLVGFAVSL